MVVKSVFTQVYGLGRSLLALSLWCTLIFSGSETLFPPVHLDFLDGEILLVKLNIFYIFRENLLVAKVLSSVVLWGVIFGWYPRVTGVLHWWLTLNFYSASYILEGGDQLMTIATFLLVPVTLLDRRTNHWQHEVMQSPAELWTGRLALFLIRLQVAVVYFIAAAGKLIRVAEWRDGTALYYHFNDEVYGAPPYLLHFFNWIFTSEVTLMAMTWTVLLFEFLMAAALFMNVKIRRKLWLPAVLFHLAIALVHGLFSFFLVMMGMLVFYLWDPGFRMAFPGVQKTDKHHPAEGVY